MSDVIHEWLHIVLRWAHIVAAIMWIGDSFLFMWLDSHLSKPWKPRLDEKGEDDKNVAGELWMTHSGGFYEVVKLKSLKELPPTLYWFKWESYSTWITGFLLIAIVYWAGGRAMMVDASSELTGAAAAAISMLLLFTGVGVYDLLCRTPLMKDNRAMGAVGLALVMGTAYALMQVFTPRAAFLQIGAMLGTIMTSNVFFRIIPAQRHMLEATKAGTPVDTSYGVRAKGRSIHNHYLTFPVLFTMLSNHFPSTYGHPQAWLVLGLVFVFGVGMKYVMNFRAQTPKPILAGTFAALAIAAFMTMPAAAPSVGDASGPPVPFAMARQIVEARCVTCHADRTTHPGFPQAQGNVKLDTPERIALHAERVLFRAVTTKTMPLGNLTGMTDEERELLGTWVRQGARTDR